MNHQQQNQQLLSGRSYKVGNTVIPGDITLFNQMWLNKEFDKITHEERFAACHPPRLCRPTNNDQTWDTAFFIKRESLLHQTADELWKRSNFMDSISREVHRIMYTSNPLVESSFEFVFSDDSVTEYLSKSPEEVMFCENKPLTYMHPAILPIYRDLISRFQYLGNRMNDERISIYLDELIEVSQKIRFIQTLCYFGIDMAVIRFKMFKPNFLDNGPSDDPDVSEIVNEYVMSKECFWKKRFKHALYDFYLLCISPEKITNQNMELIYFIGETIVQYEDIQTLVTKYMLPMRSCIKQDKLHTICCQVVLSYLKPKCITDKYIDSQLTLF